MVVFAALGPVAALVNDTLSPLGLDALIPGASQPTTGAGDDVYSYEDFVATEPLDNEAWENLMCKGENLMKAMHASNEDAGKYWNPLLPSAESTWEDFSMYLTPVHLSQILTSERRPKRLVLASANVLRIHHGQLSPGHS
jgi:hypothetical protein